MSEPTESNRRNKKRPPASFTGPGDLRDNTLGGVAYIEPQGDFSNKAPITGLLNESTATGCSVILSGTEREHLDVGKEFNVKTGMGEGKAVLKWCRKFGKDTIRAGFQFVE